MAKVITTELQHSGASGANITLDSSKNVTIEGNLTVDGTSTLTGAVTGDNAGAGKAHNILVNGAMKIAQRDTSSTSHGYSTVDMAKPYATSHGTSVSYFQSDVASGNDCYNAGFRKAFKVAISGAGNTSNSAAYIGFYKQRIEAQDIVQSGWKYWDPSSKLTLSFWIKSTTADTFQLQVYVDDNTKKKYNTPVSATTSWTKITKVIPGHADININNDTGEGLAVSLVVASGADLAGTVTQNTWVANTTAAIAASNVDTWLTAGAGNVETTGWQLEVGDTATDFEHKSYAQDLLECKRYCHVLRGDSNDMTGAVGWCGGSDGAFPYTLPVNMRAEPSFTAEGTWRLNCPGGNGANQTSDLSWANTNLTFDAGWLYLASVSTASSAGQAAFLQFRSTDAKLIWSAEL